MDVALDCGDLFSKFATFFMGKLSDESGAINLYYSPQSHQERKESQSKTKKGDESDIVVPMI